MGKILGERPLAMRTRISKRAVFRPARTCFGSKERRPRNLRGLRMFYSSLAVSEMKVLPGPGDGDSKKIGIVADERFPRAAEADHLQPRALG